MTIKQSFLTKETLKALRGDISPEKEKARKDALHFRGIKASMIGMDKLPKNLFGNGPEGRTLYRHCTQQQRYMKMRHFTYRDGDGSLYAKCDVEMDASREREARRIKYRYNEEGTLCGASWSEPYVEEEHLYEEDYKALYEREKEERERLESVLTGLQNVLNGVL